MNILPLIFTFLIVFSCLCLTFFREMKSFLLVESALSGFRRTERVVDNTLARKNYRKMKANSSQKKKTVPKRKNQSAYASRRTMSPPLEESKFNLGAIAKSETLLQTHPLYEPLANFLRILYQRRVFDQTPKVERPEYQLLEAIVKKLQKFPDADSFAELCPDDPKLKTLYYKMLKGTNQYSPGKNGIPPLADFFSLKKNTKAVNLNFASPSLLEALFGDEVSEEILKMERLKWAGTAKYYYVSKSDLQTILSKNPTTAFLLPALTPHLSDSKKFTSRNRIVGKDESTGISVRKKC